MPMTPIDESGEGNHYDNNTFVEVEMDSERKKRRPRNFKLNWRWDNSWHKQSKSHNKLSQALENIYCKPNPNAWYQPKSGFESIVAIARNETEVHGIASE